MPYGRAKLAPEGPNLSRFIPGRDGLRRGKRQIVTVEPGPKGVQGGLMDG